MGAPFTLDGRTFKVGVKSIKRRGVIGERSSGNAKTMSGEIRRDLNGTYFHYTMTIDLRLIKPNDYDALYDILTAPVNSHTVTVPYGQETLTYEAYIESVEDVVARLGAVNVWNNLTVTFYSQKPIRYPE